MRTEIIDLSVSNIDQQKLKHIAKVIRAGGVVAFPTETVYGLGANALDENAIEKIFQAKGRPSDNPLIVHISDFNQVYSLAKEIPEHGIKLMNTFWPGPLTLVLKKTDIVPKKVTAGLDTVAVRMPAHPIARAIIAEAGVPVAAPSANRSGKPSPTRAEHVINDLDGRVDIIVRAGISEVGLESTVLDITNYPPVILRPGGILPEQIKEICGQVIVPSEVLRELSQNEVPKAPGMKYTHYAPKANMIVICGDIAGQVAKINEIREKFIKENKKVAILGTAETKEHYNSECIVMGSRDNPAEIAANLFEILRNFDKTDVDIILAEAIPETGMGLAVMNRMLKASGYQIEYANGG